MTVTNAKKSDKRVNYNLSFFLVLISFFFGLLLPILYMFDALSYMLFLLYTFLIFLACRMVFKPFLFWIHKRFRPIIILRIIGVYIHEISHVLFCWLTFSQVVEFVVEKGDGTWQGHVKISHDRGILSAWLTALGPLWLGSSLILYLTQIIQNAWFVKNWVLLIVVGLIIYAILACASPSNEDFKYFFRLLRNKDHVLRSISQISCMILGFLMIHSYFPWIIHRDNTTLIPLMFLILFYGMFVVELIIEQIFQFLIISRSKI